MVSTGLERGVNGAGLEEERVDRAGVGHVGVVVGHRSALRCLHRTAAAAECLLELDLEWVAAAVAAALGAANRPLRAAARRALAAGARRSGGGRAVAIAG